MASRITVAPAPHIHESSSTRGVMVDVIIGLIPAVGAAGYYFRRHALVLIAVCVAWSVATEWLWNVFRKRPNTIGDCSAIVTGLLLALSLPPALPVWAGAIGSVFAIAIGKLVFGGLGANIFNPAMVGRAFLTASFGALMTTWTVPATIDPNMSRIAPENYVLKDSIYGRTQATPLAWSKRAIKSKLGADFYSDRRQLRAAVLGEVGGCLGETSAVALLLGGVYLMVRRTINWRIPAGVLLSAFVFAAVAYLIDRDSYVQPLFHLASGGLLLGAFFIATDPVTAPLTGRGMWIFGLGVGALTMLIRIVGEYPEGVMFAVLLMNAVTPLIDRLCMPIPVGGKPKARA